MDAHVPGWLWPIIVLGGVGALLDFLIGRIGQDRVRDFLEIWWIKFDDLGWSNFGPKEARFTINLIDRIAGAGLLSIRRITLTISVVFILLMLDILLIPAVVTHVMAVSAPPAIAISTIVISAIAFAVSISYTKQFSVFFLNLYTDSFWRNSIIVISFFTFSYAIFVLWLPTIQILSQWAELKTLDLLPRDLVSQRSVVLPKGSSLFGALIDAVKAISFVPGQICRRYVDYFILPSLNGNYLFQWEFTKSTLGYLTNAIRLLIALMFLGLILLKPMLLNPLSLIWRRLVESEKPVFTLIFGSIGSAATTAIELVKHL